MTNACPSRTDALMARLMIDELVDSIRGDPDDVRRAARRAAGLLIIQRALAPEALAHLTDAQIEGFRQARIDLLALPSRHARQT